MQPFGALPLRFGGTVERDVEICVHPGSELRGALYNPLLDKHCSTPRLASPSVCLQCPTIRECPVNIVSATYAPHAPLSARLVRPLAIEPPVLVGPAPLPD